MRVSQTVFGAYHHFDLARELGDRGHLECIFSTWPRFRLRREGIPKTKLKTFPWVITPELLLRRLGILSVWLEDELGYLNALAFDEYTSRRVGKCDALIGISGSSLKTGRLVQEHGGIFLCDRGSSHQRYQEEIIADEYRRWGLDERVSDPRDTRREELIYEQADAIVVPSIFAANSFMTMGVSASKVFVIPYGVQLEKFQRVAEPPSDRFEVLFVGSVDLRKGIPYLLKAFAEVKHRSKRLRIVGSVGRGMKAIMDQLPMTDVEVIGSVPQSVLPTMMGSSHVMVLPSVEDGFGLVIAQAMAAGCPVLVSEHTGGPDLLTDGENGFVVPIRDVEALRDRMQRIADDPALGDQFREAGRHRVETLGGWRSYGDSWESLLTMLIGAKQERLSTSP